MGVSIQSARVIINTNDNFRANSFVATVCLSFCTISLLWWGHGSSPSHCHRFMHEDVPGDDNYVTPWNGMRWWVSNGRRRRVINDSTTMIWWSWLNRGRRRRRKRSNWRFVSFVASRQQQPPPMSPIANATIKPCSPNAIDNSKRPDKSFVFITIIIISAWKNPPLSRSFPLSNNFFFSSLLSVTDFPRVFESSPPSIPLTHRPPIDGVSLERIGRQLKWSYGQYKFTEIHVALKYASLSSIDPTRTNELGRTTDDERQWNWFRNFHFN